MAKRDFILDTKGGRIYLGALSLLLLIMGPVLVVLSILLKIRGADFFWQTLVIGIGSIVGGICQLIVLKRHKPQASDKKPVTESQE